jgi:hypothetical protein
MPTSPGPVALADSYSADGAPVIQQSPTRRAVRPTQARPPSGRYGQFLLIIHHQFRTRVWTCRWVGVSLNPLGYAVDARI